MIGVQNGREQVASLECRPDAFGHSVSCRPSLDPEVAFAPPQWTEHTLCRWPTGCKHQQRAEEIDEGEYRGEAESQGGWIDAEEEVEVKGWDDVEEGAAGDQEGLDDFGAAKRCQLMGGGRKGDSYTVMVSPRLAIQTEPKAISAMLRNMRTTTTTGAYLVYLEALYHRMSPCHEKLW